MNEMDSKLTRIAIFYDGNFLHHVSNYYNYHHDRQARISISGLHEFIRNEVARCEEVAPRHCQIVDAHYFRGRLRATDAGERDLLLRERVFDDVLMREGITTHYLPVARDGEKGIDVWLALEAFEQAIYKRFSVIVLIASDGDFVPLVRKLTTLGTRVMVLAWDFRFTDREGRERETRTSQALLDEVTYPVMMHSIIDDRARRSDALVNGLFVTRREPAMPLFQPAPAAENEEQTDEAAEHIDADPMPGNTLPSTTGTIQAIKTGYGFIQMDDGSGSIFFFHSDVANRDFLELQVGQRVSFYVGQNDRGPCAKVIRVLNGNA